MFPRPRDPKRLNHFLPPKFLEHVFIHAKDCLKHCSGYRSAYGNTYFLVTVFVSKFEPPELDEAAHAVGYFTQEEYRAVCQPVSDPATKSCLGVSVFPIII